jgi:transposase InsO family protein
VSAYIDEQRDRFGVESICSVLQFAPRTYYAIKARPPSKRALREAELKPEIVRVHRDNFGVYGVDKVWAQLNRDGVRVARCTVARCTVARCTVARCTVARLMRELGLRGVVRGKPKFTRVPADAAERPRDLVDRRFSAGAPDRLRVADLTYVRTWTGSSGWPIPPTAVETLQELDPHTINATLVEPHGPYSRLESRSRRHGQLEGHSRRIAWCTRSPAALLEGPIPFAAIRVLRHVLRG